MLRCPCVENGAAAAPICCAKSKRLERRCAGEEKGRRASDNACRTAGKKSDATWCTPLAIAYENIYKH